MLPSLHGGHSVIDNHRLGECGLKPADYETSWFLAKCPNCPAKKWCYNIERPFSHQSTVEQLVAIYRCNLEIAKSKGISPFSLLVHLPIPEDFARVIATRYNVATYRDARWSMPEDDLPIFVEAIQILKSQSLDKLSVAVEVDFLPDAYSNKEILAKLLQAIPDTIIVGSVHMFEIDGELFMAGKNGNNTVQAQNFVDRKGLEEFWTAVLEHSLRLIYQHQIDILGHLFAFQKYLPKCPITPTTIQLAQMIAEELVRRQILIDINTSGLMKGIHKDDPYFPSYWLQLFQATGVKFVTGDDSHGPKQIGQGFQVCKEFLLQNGVSTLSIPYKVDGKKYFRPFDL